MCSAHAAGKSECTRCGAATGRFCRACLNVRYGERLESVREAMAAGTWLCPHCYEADHPVRLGLAWNVWSPLLA